MKKVIFFYFMLISTFVFSETYPPSFSVNVDNDAFFIGSDDYYTNGLRANVANQGVPFIEDYVNIIDKFLGNDPSKISRHYILYYANNIYTPSEENKNYIEMCDELLNDRPYAGWGRLGVEIVADRKSLERESLDISVGILGDGGASSLQTFWHLDALGIPEYKGWNTHIKDRLALQLGYNYSANCMLADEIFLSFLGWGLDLGNVFIRAECNFGAKLALPILTDEDYTHGVRFGLLGMGILSCTAYNGTLDAQNGYDYDISIMPIVYGYQVGAFLELNHGGTGFPNLIISYLLNTKSFDFTAGHTAESWWYPVDYRAYYGTLYIEFYISEDGSFKRLQDNICNQLN